MNLEEVSISNRNVHLFDGNGKYLAGLRIRTRDQYVTNANFYYMSSIVLDIEDGAPQWVIYRLVRTDRRKNTWSGRQVLPRNNQCVSVGNYAVLRTNGAYLRVRPTTEQSLRRFVSPEAKTDPTSPQTKFRDSVRARDGGCMVSGVMCAAGDEWVGYQAAHIWPLAWESAWCATPHIHGWITDAAPATEIGKSRLFSPQNGLLMTSSLLQLFDIYRFAINPDDGYKITAFDSDSFGVGGRRLHRNALDPANPHHRVSDGLLRWHFRQAVLKYVKGVGEVWPDWEHDAAGEDLLRIIREGPAPEERMELELFHRLAGWEDVSIET